MALILNIETATKVCSVSIGKDAILLTFKEMNDNYSHAENLTVFIEDLLDETNLKISNFDAIAVSKGPGSYTGLRIGVSTAKGLCYALQKPLISISTLQAMAKSPLTTHHSPLTTLFCPMLDARRMEVYCAFYDGKNKLIKNISAEIIDENSFAGILKNNTVLFFGDGSEKCKIHLSKNPNAIFIDSVFPSAKNMLELSEMAFNADDFEDLAYFEPYYLKDFVGTVAKNKT